MGAHSILASVTARFPVGERVQFKNSTPNGFYRGVTGTVLAVDVFEGEVRVRVKVDQACLYSPYPPRITEPRADPKNLILTSTPLPGPDEVERMVSELDDILLEEGDAT